MNLEKPRWFSHWHSAPPARREHIQVDKEEFDKLKQCFERREKQLRDLLDNDKVCDGCPFFVHCENEPYDCNALDKLREIAGKK